jgi:methylated-DNA-[protein]-cysteine S-methyltransferase
VGQAHVRREGLTFSAASQTSAASAATTAIMSTAFAHFHTAIGGCAIAWTGSGVLALQLPEADDDRTRARVLRRWPDAREEPPPPAVRHAIDGIVALLSGAAVDLSTVPLDMERVPAFDREVYEVARTIPPGQTLTYGEVAARLGDPGPAREVGRALARNPFAVIVPCHRVVAAGGRTGGFSATGGVTTKLRLLEIECARLTNEPTLFDHDEAFARLQRRG